MTYLFYKIVKGKKYYYLGENKSINGRSRRVVENYLGSAKSLKEHYAHGSMPKEIESISYGLPAAILNLNDELNFVNVIDKHCPKREQGLSVGEHILIDIINRLDEPSSHNKLGDWFSKTVLRKKFIVKHAYLSSQGYWNHWHYLDEKKIELIQEDLLPVLINATDIKQLFYDPTNFTTYIEDEHKASPKGKKRHDVSLAEYGKSKNGLKGFRQINLALLVTKEYGIPLWHKPYEGNTNDVTFFKEFVNSLVGKIEIFNKECKSITLVIDKGNNSPANMDKVDSNLHFFVLGSLAPSQHKDWLAIPLEKFNIEHMSAKNDVIKAHSFRAEVFGKKSSIVITYNEKTAYNQKERVDKALAKALSYLEEVKTKLNKPKWKNKDDVLIRISSYLTKVHATKLIEWNLYEKDEKLKLSFKNNTEELTYRGNSYGKAILFTDNDTLSSLEIIKAYHNKFIVEEKIRQLKNKHIISFTPQYCWTDESIRVHAFTCVMSLLFLSLLRKKILDNGIKLSYDEIIENLKNIRMGLLLMPQQKSVISMIETMTNTQKKLYSTLNLKKQES